MRDKYLLLENYMECFIKPGVSKDVVFRSVLIFKCVKENR